MNQKVEIPERIANRLDEIKVEAESILQEVSKVQLTKLNMIQFRFHQATDKGLLSDFERAQSFCFVTKYETLPELQGVFISEEQGEYRFENYAFMRHILNEYRTVIQNSQDSIYYHNIHKFVREKLVNDDPTVDLVLDVLDEYENDVTREFTKILDERIKSIRLILKRMEFNYIYNGILQHSDHELTNRFWNDYQSGEINYIFLKHATLLGPIKQLLQWHFRIINFLTFPKLGCL